MNYWFYLEPYSFIFQEDRQFVIYNTLNSAYITCPEYLPVYEIMVQLNDAANGYCVFLNENELADSVLKEFIIQVRNSFSGDLVECCNKEKKPFLFKPALYLNSDIRRKQESDMTFFGERIMQNLNEVTLYLPNSCELKCEGCGQYHKQMVHCYREEKKGMNSVDYLKILSDLHINGVNKVNISGGSLLQNPIFQDILPNLSDYGFKKVFYVESRHLLPQYMDLFAIPMSEMIVLIHAEDIGKRLIDNMILFKECGIQWRFLVSSEADMDKIEELDVPVSCHICIYPYYDGTNLDFFEKYVFYSLQDVLAEPLDKQTIFRRQALNENFFGKLTLCPSGEVYSNVNFPSLGNIQNMSLKELVYKELTEGYSWLKVRGSETPCSQCINKHLCPSISNYELVIGRSNLCKVKSE